MLRDKNLPDYENGFVNKFLTIVGISKLNINDYGQYYYINTIEKEDGKQR